MDLIIFVKIKGSQLDKGLRDYSDSTSPTGHSSRGIPKFKAKTSLSLVKNNLVTFLAKC